MNFEERTISETLCIDLRTLEQALKIESYCLNELLAGNAFETTLSFGRTMNTLITLFFENTIRPEYQELDALVDKKED